MRGQSLRAASLLRPASGQGRGFTLRNAIGRWLTATVVVGGLLAAGSPAIAGQAAPSLATHALSAQQQARAAARDASGLKAVPDAVGDESQICLTNATSYCIKTNGTGNQVTITSVAADKANFTVVYDSGGVHGWQDGNGNCLREGTGGVVKIENGPCNTSDNAISGTTQVPPGTAITMPISCTPTAMSPATKSGPVIPPSRMAAIASGTRLRDPGRRRPASGCQQLLHPAGARHAPASIVTTAATA